MRRLVAFLIVFVAICCMTLIMSAGAEENSWICDLCGAENTMNVCETCGTPHQDPLTEDQMYTLRSAFICALDMKAQAMNGTWTEAQKAWADRIASIDAAHPRAGMILMIPQKVKPNLIDWLGNTDMWLHELNTKLNAVYSWDYADVANTIAIQTSKDWLTDVSEDILAVLLVYDQDMVLCWSAAEFDLCGLCLIGSESVNAQFGEESMQIFLDSIGLQDAEMMLLSTTESIDAVKSEAVMPLFFNEKIMAENVTATPESVMIMLPELFESGLFTKWSVGSTMVISYLQQHIASPEATLETVTFIHEQMEPVIDTYGYGSPGFWNTGIYMKSDDELLSLSENWEPPVALEGGETDAEPDAEPLKKDGRILAVCRQTTVSGKVTTQIQYYLQTCMDEQFNPGSPEAADYVLLVDTHWEEGEPHGNIRMFKAVSVVTLNDAKTGKVLMNMGTRRDGAYGLITVHGNAYYQDPRMEGLWNDTIAPALFPDKQ